MVSFYRSDDDVRQAVEDEIQFDPSVMDDKHIAVSVNEGVVALGGFTKTYLDAYYAEKAAKRVQGVRGVANDIHVKAPAERSDPDIAEDAARALKASVTCDTIKPVVKNGHLTLEGQADWNYQREWAERSMRAIGGVKSVTNLVQIRPKVAPEDVKRKIQAALVRSAQIDADRITVEVDGGSVTLKGTVRTWAESQQAQRSAWSAAGVTQVNNNISISG